MRSPDGSALSLDLAFEPALETIRTSNDELLMLPKDMSEVILFYRTDLIEEPPETWEEFIATAKQFTRSLNPESATEYGAVLQGKYEMWTFCAALENLWPYGAQIFDDSMSSSGIDTPRAVENGLHVYEELARLRAIPMDSANAEHPQVMEIFQSGNVAMAMQWNAMYDTVIDPEYSPLVHDRFSIAPPPGVRREDGSIERSMYMQTIGLALNGNSKHKREAFRFIAWACLGEGAEIYADAGGSSPVDAVWAGQNARMPYKMLVPWTKEMGRAVPHHARLPELMMIGSSWVQRVVVGNVTSEEAVRGMSQEIAETIAK